MDNLIWLYNKKQSEEVVEILSKGINEAQELLRNGINVNTRNDKGESALTIAAKRNDEEFLKFLLDHGAKFCNDQRPGNLRYVRPHSDEYISANDAFMLWAAEKGLQKTVEIQIQRGADVNAIDF